MFGRFSHVRNRAFGTNIAVNWRLLDGISVLQPSDQINIVHLGYPHVQPDADQRDPAWSQSSQGVARRLWSE